MMESLSLTSKMHISVLITCMFFIFCSVEGRERSRMKRDDISTLEFLEKLFTNSTYNKRSRPDLGTGKPTVIKIDLFINDVSSVSEVSMDFCINIFLRQRWNDERLIFPPGVENNGTLTLNYEHFHKLWVPDLFFTNEKEARFHEITTPNRFIQISANGDVLYSQRLSMKLGCDMRLQRYPLDQQICQIKIESYGYLTSDIVFQWQDQVDPIQVREGLVLPEFNLTSTGTGDCTSGYTTGAFTCLFMELHLDRLFEFYLIQVYIPNVLIVVLSWVSFWIDMNAVPARISLGLLTVLTITTQASGMSANLPKVSYIKAIDVWMFINMVYVFGALIEYAIVNVLARKHGNSNVKHRANSQSGISYTNMGNIHDGLIDNTNHKKICTLDDQIGKMKEGKDLIDDASSTSSTFSYLKKVRKNRAQLLDLIARILFPSTYIAFNFLYWYTYLTLMKE